MADHSGPVKGGVGMMKQKENGFERDKTLGIEDLLHLRDEDAMRVFILGF